MTDRIKEAFDSIYAEEKLKAKTKVFIAEKRQKAMKPRTSGTYRRFVVTVCLLLILIGGYGFYFTPTAAISIDINPSIELGVNRFDRVISITGYNDDGRALAETLDIKFADYSEAVNRILENAEIKTLLSEDEVMTITVTGQNEEQSDRILSGVQTCTEGQKNAYCYLAHQEEMEQAHELGLSYGKYRTLLEMQDFGYEISPDEIKDMTMREIRDLLNDLEIEDPTQGKNPGHHGSGNGYGHR